MGEGDDLQIARMSLDLQHSSYSKILLVLLYIWHLRGPYELGEDMQRRC